MNPNRQWTAVNLQVVNWGGFDYELVPFSPSTTALTGVSGAGKSTLMDAYIALMMDSNTPFNSASNDNTTGGARSDAQRNVLSYMRGKIDSSRDEGALTAQVLRGIGEATWSAISMTWSSGDEQFTAGRIYHAKSSAKKYGDVSPHFFTTPGAFELPELAAFAAGQFDHRLIRAKHPSMAFHAGPAEFSNKFQTTLGIGDASHPEVGTKALKLLARVQQGGQISRVNSLYTETVLERPETFDYAQKAMKHFRDMEITYLAMKEAEEKVEALSGLDEAHDSLIAAQSAALSIASLGMQDSHDSPWARWTAEAELSTLTEALDDNRSARARIDGELAAQEAQRDALRLKSDELDELVSANGGDALALHHASIRAAKVRLDGVDVASKAAISASARVLADLTSESGLTTACKAAELFLGGFPTATDELDEAFVTIAGEGARAVDKIKEISSELASLNGRESLIGRDHHDARVRLAEAIGLDADEVPFIAELIDVAPGFDQWRQAANLALGGWAMHVLVDERRLQEFKRAINHLEIKRRIKFKGVPVGAVHVGANDLRLLSGRLEVREDSPFRGWVSSTLARQFAYTCVDDVRDLERYGKTLTIQGQTNDGNTGAHGDSGARSVLGFSNEALKESLHREKLMLQEAAAKLNLRASDNRAALSALQLDEAAHRSVLQLRWPAIDVSTAREELRATQQRLTDFTDQNDVLRQLQAELNDVKEDVESSLETVGALKSKRQDAREVHSRLVDREDLCNDSIMRMDESNSGQLTPSHRELIASDPITADMGDYKAFAAQLKRLAASLNTRRAAEEKIVASRLNELRKIFATFLHQWSDPNLSDHPTEAYPAFKELFDTLVHTGLHVTRTKFSEHVNEWAADDLVSLNAAYSSAHSSIRERLDDVNDVLYALPFGANDDRLKITLRENRSGEVDDFRRDLQALASYSSVKVEESQIEARWKQITAFMTRLDPDTKGGARDRVLDVRKHVHIEAEKVNGANESLAVYDTLGDKSGGETQELVAFIIGAALRYQLGDAGLGHPRYRPVFLDEGFIKADSEFAGRSVKAWLGLGFQLIIGAPIDKITGLEPHMESLLLVLKTKNQSRVVPILTAATAHLEAEFVNL